MVRKVKPEDVKIELLKDLYHQYVNNRPHGSRDYIRMDRIERQTDYYSLDKNIKNAFIAKQAAFEELREEGYAEIYRYPKEYQVRITPKGIEYVKNHL